MQDTAVIVPAIKLTQKLLLIVAGHLELARFCTRVLDQVHSKSAPEHLKQAHQTYLEIYRLIDENDELLAALFDDWRRSTAFMALAGWLSHGLVTEEEFETLSTETQAVMSSTVDITFYQ